MHKACTQSWCNKSLSPIINNLHVFELKIFFIVFIPNWPSEARYFNSLECSAFRLCLFVCLLHDYAHTLLPIVITFGMNVIGTNTKWRMCKEFLISLPFRNNSQFVEFFRSYGRRARSTFQTTTSSLLLGQKSIYFYKIWKKLVYLTIKTTIFEQNRKIISCDT